MWQNSGWMTPGLLGVFCDKWWEDIWYFMKKNILITRWVYLNIVHQYCKFIDLFDKVNIFLLSHGNEDQIIHIC